MASQLRIDQAGLNDGLAGTSRTDGLATGAVVTLINTGFGSTTVFQILWAPPGDTTAVSTLTPTGDPKVWTFEPTPNRYGTYLVELIEDEELVTEVRERRAFVVRTPGLGLVIPALNERGDPRASLALAGAAQVEAADNNAVDYSDATLNSVPYAAWWRALHELTLNVDASVPFLHVRYVDGRTLTPDDEQTGSVDRPFRLLQSAVDAIPTTTEGYTPIGGVLLIAGASYTAEGVICPIGMSFTGLGSGRNSDIPAARAFLGSVGSDIYPLEFCSVTVLGFVVAAAVRGGDTAFLGPVTATSGLLVQNCSFAGGLSADYLNAESCWISGDVIFNVAEIVNSTIVSAVLTGATLEIDRYTFERAKAAGIDFAGVTTINVFDRAGTFSAPEEVEVIVPELIGSTVTAVDVSTVGSGLEGIDQPQIVLATPSDDNGAGIYRNVYVSGADTLRFAFAGPFAGGTVLFRVSRLY